MDSILNSVKKMCGIPETDTYFDPDLIIHINTVFSILTQIGIGPNKGYSISDNLSIWTDFLENKTDLELVKTYMFMKVKLMFDPPTSSALTEVYNRNIAELEWRLSVTVGLNGEGEINV